MAKINFPANPIQGQEYVFNNFKYIFNGNRWQSARNDSSADLDYFKKDLADSNSTVLIAGIPAKDIADQKDGIPATAVMWFPSRKANHTGYIPADGQLLSRGLYTSLWKAIEDGKVPVTTDEIWLSGASNRGGYSTGDGSTTFRVPDYNGKIPDSIATFLRGDGTNSAGIEGMIQGDAIRNISGHVGAAVDAGLTGPGSHSGVFTQGTGAKTYGLSGAAGGSNKYDVVFDASRVVPTADENRPVNVTGVWMIKAFSYVANEGVVDAGHMASALAAAEAKIQILEAKNDKHYFYSRNFNKIDIGNNSSVLPVMTFINSKYGINPHNNKDGVTVTKKGRYRVSYSYTLEPLQSNSQNTTLTVYAGKPGVTGMTVVYNYIPAVSSGTVMCPATYTEVFDLEAGDDVYFRVSCVNNTIGKLWDLGHFQVEEI